MKNDGLSLLVDYGEAKPAKDFTFRVSMTIYKYYMLWASSVCLFQYSSQKHAIKCMVCGHFLHCICYNNNLFVPCSDVYLRVCGGLSMFVAHRLSVNTLYKVMFSVIPVTWT